MDKNKSPNWKEFHTIIFDFDGIFTNNKVLVDELGKESVFCDRRDGLGIELLKKFKKNNDWDLDFFILSKETNQVVKRRAEKLDLICYQSIDTKLSFLRNYLEKRSKTKPYSFDGVIYLGNDINDFECMKSVGFSVAPSDSHALILEIATVIMKNKGGDAFVRDFIELLIFKSNKLISEDYL